MITTRFYVQPVAWHLLFPERFLLRGEDDGWYLWTGEDATAAPEAIPDEIAVWLRTKQWMIPFAETSPWVQTDDLPLAPAPLFTRWRV